MTKYILHGGNTSDKNKHNDNFFAEIGNSASKGGTVLLNYFSRNDDWNILAEGDKEKILINTSSKNLKFEIAQSSTLVKQIKKADVMYMRGG